MGCPAGFVFSVNDGTCVSSVDEPGTDPSYFQVPTTGDISYTGDPGITPPSTNADLCQVGGIDANGDTIASCGVGGFSPVGSNGAVTTTPVSSSVWQSIGGVLGAVFGGFSSSSAISGLGTATKTCPNGQKVLSTQPCPAAASSLLGSSSSSLMILALAAVLFFVVRAVRK